jgi:primosomal protein N' (replication factor Y)
MIIDVLPNSKVKGEIKTFSYLAPPELESQIKVGQLVMVPFGPRKITGIVVKVKPQRDEASDLQQGLTSKQKKVSPRQPKLYNLRPITSIVELTPVIDLTHLTLARFIADYYLCDLSQALFLMLPKKLKSGKKNVRLQKSKFTPKEKSPLSTEFFNASLKPKTCFTPEQQSAFDKISKSIIDKRLSMIDRSFLLHGVTGSGKTEIYLAAAKLAQSHGKKSIILVPEIAITAQVVDFFQTTFGEKIAVFHSQLSEGQKLNIWEKCRNGEIDLVIGPRSALFLPLSPLGLIVVDEEQDLSYKSDQTPRYHARKVSEKLAELTSSVLIFGSATPSIETYFRAQKGEIKLLELKERYRPLSNRQAHKCTSVQTEKKSEFASKQESPTSVDDLDSKLKIRDSSLSLPIYSTDLPQVQIVDMRHEFHLGNKSVISETLQNEITKVLKQKRQIFLFMNRRGAATFILCRDCGHVELCPKCEVPLTLHLKAQSTKHNTFLLCHHCSTRYPSPTICPNCSSQNIRFFGTGTQKIELEAKKLFPKANIVRLDLDAQTKPEIVYEKIKNADIVIGTQLIAKNWDLPKVDLVGIISADLGLNLPDFCAAENSFQTLTQVAGRAGRREQTGKVIIQTYDPENQVIKSAAKLDYLNFYTREIQSRKKFNYLPFSRLIRIIISHKDQNKAQTIANEIAQKISACTTFNLRPAACFYSKLHNKFRLQIVLKVPAADRSLLDAHLKEILQKFPSVTIDIDPISLL